MLHSSRLMHHCLLLRYRGSSTALLAYVAGVLAVAPPRQAQSVSSDEEVAMFDGTGAQFCA